MEVIEQEILEVTAKETNQEAEMEMAEFLAGLTNVFTVSFVQSQVMVLCSAIGGLISNIKGHLKEINKLLSKVKETIMMQDSLPLSIMAIKWDSSTLNCPQPILPLRNCQ
ncbi:hypothetical protein ACOSP7_013692 [Xanthoceras sorbifolium]